MAALKKAAHARADATFHDHLKELRSRAFVVVLVFLIAASLAYSYKDPILALLMQPLDGEQLIYLTPGGGFAFIFQVSLFMGIIAATPVLMFSVFRFLAPVLSGKTRLLSVGVMIASVVLLCGGATFGYVFAIPAAMNFLLHFADGFASASLTAQSYLSFVMAYTAGLGLLFQLPLILLLIHWIKPLKPGKLMSFQRYVILFSFIIAALISPTPDALNQVIIAVPIIVMYQLGVLAIWISVLRAGRKVKKAHRLHKSTATVVPHSAALSSAIPTPAAVVVTPVAVAYTPAQKVAPVVPVAAPANATSGVRRRTMEGFGPRPQVRAQPLASGSSLRVPPRPSRVITQGSGRVATGRSIDGVSVVKSA